MVESLRNLFAVAELRNRVLFTLALLAVYRIGNHIPTPGVNTEALAMLAEQARNTMFGLYDLFSGGNLSRVTILALAIMPYISGSIILQLLPVVWPSLEKLKDDRRADVGHDAQRKDRHPRQVASREQVVEPEHRVARLLREHGQRLGVHAGRRDMVPNPIHGEQREREQHAIAQLGDLEDVPEAFDHIALSGLEDFRRSARSRNLLGGLAAEL